ncbi:tetratricopeptide repeat protein [Sphingomonas sp. HDW15A]|uniref:SPOR domain-containing protein n=1 Tax=Sphingomonas sp. HDW15A TaxID=2714942 RepID=UPI001409C892|nr:SPOR domain-containing protein [Sphingomonas sp. HDW15A]QIK95999.1 tetratricopeptide repeat protein [Sphingomonas sp. HDW15A]
MASAMRIGTAMTAVGMIGMITACASPGTMASRSNSASSTASADNVGLASRALAALESGNHAEAISLAERAVEYKPEDAMFRAILGNSYFAAGRFASAETAFQDSLALSTNQPQVVLKLALVTIALGKNNSAINLLQSAQEMLDPADYGLALALAGRPEDAAAVLDSVARQAGADARVRQNLALAHALAGDWAMARTVAEQDLPPDQVESRVREWMAFAKPGRPSDQVAALTGITPVMIDEGQPIRLALVAQPTRQAEAETAAENAPVVETASVEAPVEATVVEQAVPAVAVATAMPTYVPAAPVETAEVTPEPAEAPVEQAAPVMVSAPIVQEAPQEVALPAVAIAAAMPAAAAPVIAPDASAPSIEADLSKPKKAAPMRRASLALVTAGGPVVQLGAFSNRGNVESAWARYSAKYPALRNYRPATARFEKGESTVYRLSVAGFGSSREAQTFCSTLKRSGGNCFVRSSGGDQAVRIALK